MITKSLSIFQADSFALIIGILLLLLSFTGCKMTNSADELLPRNQKLPLFDPHVASYTCSPATLPTLDAQAEAWFQEARAMESADIYDDDRDYTKIVSLTRQAAERLHWKAILNLASLYLEGRDPNHSIEDAVLLVEQAMRLGVPAAFDRMGTYYMNGNGVKTDATRAYAFWQLAARLGSPEALTYIGAKLTSADDHPERAEWANETVGTKMLECAYAQGYGLAAYELAFQFSIPTHHEPSKKEMAQALKILHEGVKFGCQKCAVSLASEFSVTRPPSEMVAPHLDNARAERYRVLSRALDFDPDRRFPNLDKILPLPPAELSSWNGDHDTLINAARGISFPPTPPRSPSASSERNGRHYLDPNYRLVPTNDTTEEATAPFTGYWQPVINENHPRQDSSGKAVEPALYQVGERFEPLQDLRSSHAERGAPAPRWQNWRTVQHDQGNISPPVVSGRTRQIKPPAKATACASSERCPVTGTWQPWLHAVHPMQESVNQYWRQVWLVEGQRFSDVRLNCMLDVDADEITWHLMDDVGIDICPA